MHEALWRNVASGKTPILIDAGPLIALILEDDEQHEAVVEEFLRLTAAPTTVWAAVAEAMYLLGNLAGTKAQMRLWNLLLADRVRLLQPLPSENVRAAALMEQYADLPMDLADALLVAIAENNRDPRIFTLDFRDFSTYRILLRPEDKPSSYKPTPTPFNIIPKPPDKKRR